MLTSCRWYNINYTINLVNLGIFPKDIKYAFLFAKPLFTDKVLYHNFFYLRNSIGLVLSNIWHKKGLIFPDYCNIYLNLAQSFLSKSLKKSTKNACYAICQNWLCLLYNHVIECCLTWSLSINYPVKIRNFSISFLLRKVIWI